MTLKNEHQHTTMCINHWADGTNIKGITFNNHCSGLTGNCFEMPNASYTNRYRQVVEKEIHIGKSLKDEVRKLYQKKS